MKKLLKLIIGNKKTKRWVLLTIIGMLLTCYEFAKIISLDRLEVAELLKIAIFFIIGFACFILGLVFLQRRILELAVNPEMMKSKNPINSKGPNVVVIGGGNGLNTVLQGLKKYTSNITAIVTVSKYGKEDLSTTEDIKISLEALAKKPEEMQKMLEYNFVDNKGNTLNFGDLYIEAVRNINGNLATSVQKSNEIFAMTGKVLPVTLDEMKIFVELENGMIIKDKDRIAEITEDRVTKINRVFINPSNCRTAPGIVDAIKNADAIILGPGSLYTNVIPNLLIKNVAKAIRDSKAFKIYVSNIMTEPGHTDDYNVSDHIDAIIEHAGNKIIDYCICDNGDIIPEFIRKYNKEGSNLVDVDSQYFRGKGIKLIKADISCVDGEHIRHDSDELAKTIIELICNELKFRDQQNDDKYLLLNSRLKEAKKNNKTKKLRRKTTRKPRKKGKTSKFASKYSERIEAIKQSDEIRKQNIKLEEQKQKMTRKKK